MKKQSFKLSFKRVIVMSGLVCALTLASFTTTKANYHTTEKSSQSAIQYVGSTDNKIIFNVKFDNSNESRFNLVISNESGDVLFSKSYNDKNFDKKIVLLKEAGDAHLTFSVRGGDVNFKQSFDITTTTKVIDEVVVTKM